MEKKRKKSSIVHGLLSYEMKVVIPIVLLNFISQFVFAEPYYLAAIPCQKTKQELSRIQTEAQQGVAQAQLELGKEYSQGFCFRQDGEITEQNLVEAAQWLQKAADQGLVEAKYRLGRVTRDDKKSFELIKEAAEQGSAEAQYWIGSSYERGFHGISKNELLASMWYEKAARQDHVQAMSSLGYMYLKGIGVTADRTKAIQWYRQAAAAGARSDGTGDWNPALRLIEILFEGPPDPITDQELAVLCRKTADAGMQGAKELGLLYEQGRGVEKDLETAYMWYSIAGSWDREVQDRKKALSRFLTQDQINQAEFKAKEYRKEHPVRIEY